MTDTCPNCNAVIVPGTDSCNSCGKPLSQQKAGFCSNCGAPLASKYAPCAQCGHTKTVMSGKIPSAPNTQNYAPNPYKTESTTLILSILLGLLGLNGVGHMYIGKVGKGVGLLIGCIILFVIGISTVAFGIGIVFLLAYFGVFIWQIIDSKKLCREYNERLANTGQPPW